MAKRTPARRVAPVRPWPGTLFWTLIVSLIIFAAGGAVSAYEGILRLLHPNPPESSIWNYVVLGAAACFEGTSFYIGTQQFRKSYANQGFWQVVRSSKDPTIFTIVFEDAMDLAGLAVAFAGVWLSGYFKTSVFDGIASVVIGALLMVVAVLLVRESKGLLTGESVRPEMRRRIRRIPESDRDVASVSLPLTMYFGPETILLAVDIQFRGGLTGDDVARAVDRIEAAVQAEYPKVKRIFIEAESIRAGSTGVEPRSRTTYPRYSAQCARRIARCASSSRCTDFKRHWTAPPATSFKLPFSGVPRPELCPVSVSYLQPRHSR